MAGHLTLSNGDGFKKWCISSKMHRTNDDSCGMAVKRRGMLAICARKMTTLIVKVETVTLIGKGS